MINNADRTMSAFPLSIGTSLAFESLFQGRQPPYDPDRKVIRIDISKYNLNNFYINIWSLHRNIIGAYSTEQQTYLNPNKIYKDFVEEIEMIEDILSNEGKNMMKPVFYLPSYKTIYKRSHKNVNLRRESTAKQLFHKNLYEESIKNILKDPVIGSKVVDVDHQLPTSLTEENLVLTHIPYDLLSYKRMKNLILLESHTGAFKTRELFPTKYYGGEEIKNIPFQEKLLKILGDNVMFHPQMLKLRKLIIDISKKGGWTPFTTEDKVRFDLDLYLKERYILSDYYDVI